jgi:ribosomal-protein-serine acetyltransferase
MLEPVGEPLAEILWAAVEPSLPELRAWLPWAVTPSFEETLNFARRSERLWDEGTEFSFVVFRDSEVLGGVGLSVDAPLGVGEVGYWLRTDVTGQGYATEAARATIEFGFEALALDRIELRAGVGNERSWRLAERLGFRREGTLREAGKAAGGRYDCYLYALLVRDRSG